MLCWSIHNCLLNWTFNPCIIYQIIWQKWKVNNFCFTWMTPSGTSTKLMIDWYLKTRTMSDIGLLLLLNAVVYSGVPHHPDQIHPGPCKAQAAKWIAAARAASWDSDFGPCSWGCCCCRQGCSCRCARQDSVTELTIYRRMCRYLWQRDNLVSRFFRL